ncbi:MAG TPA: AmmeMemoRadiSam system protein B [Verrucomicrobiae bacterium]|nr:AmmeMemoRadiSam system protein B [Verrucomicrobiae bacterium]
MAPPQRPRLRALEAFPIQQDGQRAVGLRDPARFTHQVAVLPVPLLDIVSLFDGEHSLDEIRDIVSGRHGVALTRAEIGAVAERLDEGGFLDSPRFAARRQRIEAEYAACSTRPAAHAGGAYAGEPDALRLQIEGFFRSPIGPGAEAVSEASVVSGSDLRSPQGATSVGSHGPEAGALAPLRGLLAPHIDFHRGGPTYAWAYREILRRADADCFVILGTCHAGMPDPFAATRKAYETPLGAASVDRDMLEALGRRYGHDLFASEGAHRVEHSIEFQSVMLRWALGDRRPFTVVPVLASFLHEAVWTGAAPEADPRVPRFVEALAATIAASNRRVCVIGGVDLAHVGPQFGDAEPNTAAFLRDLERDDRAMLDAVVAGDSAAFYDSIARDGDARRICGLSPIYTFLRALPGARGELLRYSQWPDPQGTVSFCAAAFA